MIKTHKNTMKSIPISSIREDLMSVAPEFLILNSSQTCH